MSTSRRSARCSRSDTVTIACRLCMIVIVQTLHTIVFLMANTLFSSWRTECMTSPVFPNSVKANKICDLHHRANRLIPTQSLLLYITTITNVHIHASFSNVAVFVYCTMHQTVVSQQTSSHPSKPSRQSYLCQSKHMGVNFVQSNTKQQV